MTLAEAIACAKAGEAAGFAGLFRHTVPHVWLAAVLLGCDKPGAAVTQVYRQAQAAVSSLHSPSELRVWIGTIAYAVLLPQAQETGAALPGLPQPLDAVYARLRTLPVPERTALLLLCGEGCSAPQAAQILAQPEIEIKRAMRRARQTVAAQMQETHPDVSCNTAGLTALLAELRTLQTQEKQPQLDDILRCIQTGTAYTEPEAAAEPETAAVPPAQADSAAAEAADRQGFFQKLFRSRRFGS